MAYITVRATDGNVSKKGEITAVYDAPVFSNANRLPRVLRIEITNATAVQIENWLERLEEVIEYSILVQNAQGWRVKVAMDPKVAAIASKTGVKQAIKDYLLGQNEADPHPDWVATQHSQTSSEIVLNIAKGQPANLAQIQAEVDEWFRDKVADTILWRRWKFPDSVVDPRVTQGVIDEAANELPDGNLPEDWVHDSITKAQALAVVVDRLA